MIQIKPDNGRTFLFIRALSLVPGTWDDSTRTWTSDISIDYFFLLISLKTTSGRQNLIVLLITRFIGV